MTRRAQTELGEHEQDRCCRRYSRDDAAEDEQDSPTTPNECESEDQNANTNSKEKTPFGVSEHLNT